MFQQRTLWLAVLLVSCCLQARGADKYTDENRPYEFGFTIDGEQHRHEKKDENGLIMGEFGFITADGVYHVTVYATDENGNFKILSMKNLRVKPFPTAGGPQSRALDLPSTGPKSGQPVPKGPAVPPRGLPGLPEAAPVKSCSGCSIPTSTTQPPKQLTDLAIVSRANEQFPPYPEQLSNNRGRQLGPEQNQASFGGQSNPLFGNEQGQPGFPPNDQFNGVTGGNNGLGGGINQPDQQAGQFGQQPGQFGQQPGQFGQQPGQIGQQLDQPGSQPGHFSQQPGQFNQQPGPFGQQPGQFGQEPGQFGQQPGQFGQEPGQFGQQPSQTTGPSKPTLISAQMQIVDSNTDVNKLGPGEQQGLPNGLHKDDMLQLLYTFNYTVGFHGHHEEGYTNGAKKGYYYVTGRNGIRTRIDYTADETGFHPKISNEVLDLLSDDVPKPESEKDEKYGLKGYEFKWLYYPPSSQK